MTPEKDQIITEMIRESLRDWFKKKNGLESTPQVKLLVNVVQ